MKGEELKIKRRIVGLTQDELANRVGVTKQSISNAEKGIGMSIPLDRLIDYEIAKAFVEMDVTKLTIIRV